MTSLSSFGAESPLGKQWAAARPDLDTSPTEVIAPVRQAFALLNAALEPLYETAPLSAPELDVLIHLRYAEEPMIARRLAQLLGVSPAAVSKSLVKLERRGFIRREPNPAGRRAVRITATEAGAAAADGLSPASSPSSTAPGGPRRQGTVVGRSEDPDKGAGPREVREGEPPGCHPFNATGWLWRQAAEQRAQAGRMA